MTVVLIVAGASFIVMVTAVVCCAISNCAVAIFRRVMFEPPMDDTITVPFGFTMDARDMSHRCRVDAGPKCVMYRLDVARPLELATKTELMEGVVTDSPRRFKYPG